MVAVPFADLEHIVLLRYVPPRAQRWYPPAHDKWTMRPPAAHRTSMAFGLEIGEIVLKTERIDCEDLETHKDH